ncbi:hypothetical protein SAMN06272735_4581 [Streptomyces sp. TLI_55]|uniref:DUF5955 family protein n=1 Tax=Streptomyces sp. TLI_55 TaxID=1938861 RepID=UPI000BD02E4B|nr:DUF5955 family protein [Streptomyces sp. TLI_55]SNX62792.1 hypothetical protein SAMN06272735_4581 [Streptomyces sp. TLI_55]
MTHSDGDHFGNITGNLFSRVQNATGGDVYVGAPTQDPTALELQRLIAELQQLLTQYATVLPDADGLRDDTEQLGAQLQRDRPNPSVVRGLLDSLTAGAGSVTAVLTAVRSLASFVSGLL